MKDSISKYLSSFLVGFFGGLFIIFAPSLIPPVGVATAAFNNFFFQTFPYLEKLISRNIFVFAIPYLLISLPIFLVYILNLWFRRKDKDRNREPFLILYSFFGFYLGMGFSFLIFVILAGIALTQWRGPW